jgi:hypothetical protein
MRQYLISTLVVSMSCALILVGCSNADRAAMNRSLYVDQHPELPQLTADAIQKGQIMVGMNQEMVEVAWGKPVRKEPVNLEDATSHWIYGNYFVGGNVTNLFFDPEGLLVRYEVNNQPVHANSGTLQAPGDAAAQGILSPTQDGTLSKESGQP